MNTQWTHVPSIPQLPLVQPPSQSIVCSQRNPRAQVCTWASSSPALLPPWKDAKPPPLATTSLVAMLSLYHDLSPSLIRLISNCNTRFRLPSSKQSLSDCISTDAGYKYLTIMRDPALQALYLATEAQVALCKYQVKSRSLPECIQLYPCTRRGA